MGRMKLDELGVAFAEMTNLQAKSLLEVSQPLRDGSTSVMSSIASLIEREVEVMKADQAVRALIELALVKIERLEIRSAGDGNGIDKTELIKFLGPVFEAVAKNIRATVKASEAEMVDLIAGMERRITVLEERTTKRRK